MTPDDALDVLVEACYQLPRDDRRTAAVDTLRAWARDIRTNPVRVVVECQHGMMPAQVRGTLGPAERERVRHALADNGGRGADAVLRDALLTVDVFDVPDTAATSPAAPEVRWSPGDGRLYVFVEDGRGGVPGWVAVWNEATAGIPMGVWGQREPADAVPLVVTR